MQFTSFIQFTTLFPRTPLVKSLAANEYKEDSARDLFYCI